MKEIILAGGAGTRRYPLTCEDRKRMHYRSWCNSPKKHSGTKLD